MRLYLDIDSRKFVASASEQRPVTGIEVKRRDTDLIELQFLRDRTVQELPTGTTIRLGLKPAANYTADFIASGTFTKSGTGTSTKYLLDLNLNTVALNAAFAAATPEPETLAAMLEVEWASGTNISSSLTLPVVINNDVIRGNEGTPATLPLFYTASTSDFKATQEQAQFGDDNAVWMTPLRVTQAIEYKLALGDIPVIRLEGAWSAAAIDDKGAYFGGGGVNFEEGWLRDASGELLLDWSDDETGLGVNNRTLKNVGRPYAATDAVRLSELAAAATYNFTVANQGTAVVPDGGDYFNLRYTINSTNLTADPVVILPHASDGAKFGATYRIVYNRTGHTRSLIVRNYQGGSIQALNTIATLAAPGVYGFCFNGTDWQTESSWTGLQPVA